MNKTKSDEKDDGATTGETKRTSGSPIEVGGGLRAIGRSHSATRYRPNPNDPAATSAPPKTPKKEARDHITSTSMSFTVGFIVMMKDMAHDLNREARIISGVKGAVSMTSMVRAAVSEFRALTLDQKLAILDKYRD